MHAISRDRFVFLAAFALNLSLFAVGCDDSCKPDPERQRVFHVRPDSSGLFPTIAAAVAACVDGDVVELAEGTYRGEGNRDIDFLGKKITVRSESGDPRTCSIDCEGTGEEPHRAFWFHLDEDRNSVLADISIIHGGVEQDGGGILCEHGSSPVLRNLIISACRARYLGGGIYCDDNSSVLIQDCTLAANRAAEGGGLCSWDASARIERCHFEENSALWGGGAAVSLSGSPETTFEGCVFQRNAAYSGGAMYLDYTECRVFNCLTRNNRGVYGGAFFCGDASPLIMGCTSFADSSANGASLCCVEHSSPVLISCTLSHGYAHAGGSAISLADGSSPILERCIISFCRGGMAISPEGAGDVPLLRCTNIFGNESGDWTGLIAEQMTEDGNIGEDPLFCDPDSGNLQLRLDSPCREGHSACGSMGAWPVGCP